MSKKPHFRTPFGSQHVKKVPNTAEICTRALLSYLFNTVREIELWNVSFRDIWNLRTFFNTLTAKNNYSLGNRENLLEQIQMQLSQKLIDFSRFFAAILKCKSNFEQSFKNDKPHSLCISEIIDSDRRVYLNV